MNRPLFTRREALALGARVTAAAAMGAALRPLLRALPGTGLPGRIFDPIDFGAAGDGVAIDTAPIQRAIDAAVAAGVGSQVLLRDGKKYLAGGLLLKGGIDFHLEGDAELRLSTKPDDFPGGAAALSASGADGLSISGTGTINGRSPELMLRYDDKNEWWRPGPFRPRLLHLTGCRGLKVTGVTLLHAPHWTLHLTGCAGVLVDGIRIRNQLDVPNCDGIDVDHCRDVDIRNCDIVCGDDGIVIKTTRQDTAYGPTSNIAIRDCRFETQDAAIKIGTETVQNISNVRVERCKIPVSSRGLCIQLRDEGNVSDVEFRDIRFVSRNFSDPWWGHGEGISLTAIPRAPGARVGRISGVRFREISGRAENSVRICGSAQSRIRDVVMEDVAITLDHWTKYRGGIWDNRPTTAVPGIEPHGIPGFGIRNADTIELRRCSVAWGRNLPAYFTSALEAEDVTGLKLEGFSGQAAHPGIDPPVAIR